jgi:hypothetical protein
MITAPSRRNDLYPHAAAMPTEEDAIVAEIYLGSEPWT